MLTPRPWHHQHDDEREQPEHEGSDCPPRRVPLPPPRHLHRQRHRDERERHHDQSDHGDGLHLTEDGERVLDAGGDVDQQRLDELKVSRGDEIGAKDKDRDPASDRERRGLGDV